MPTKKLKRQDKMFLKKLGQRVEERILDKMGYSSLDAFSLEHHDQVTKKTLYDLCKGERDFKLSTLLGLAEAFGITPSELLKGL